MLPRRSNPWAWLFGAALSIRILWAALLVSKAPEIVQFPVIDAAFYHGWAQDILADTGLSKVAFVAHPLYPYLLAAVYGITGPTPIAILAIQCLLGAFTCVILAKASEEFFDRTVGLIAGWGLALFWPAIANAALLETVELGNFLFAVSIFAWAKRQSRGLALPMAAGIALAGAALCRGNILVVVPAYVISAWLADRRNAARPIGLFTFGILAVFFCIGLRNRIVANQWLLLPGHSGIALYAGLMPGNETGTYQAPPFVRPDPRYEQHDFKVEAERRLGRPLNTVDVSRYWRNQAVNAALEDPSGFVLRTIRKFGLAIANYEIGDNYSLDYLAGTSWPIPCFSLLFATAVIGLGCSWHHRRSLAFVYLSVGLYMGTLLVYFVSSRLRAPLWILFAPFSAAGVMWTIRTWNMGGRVWIAVLLGACLAVTSYGLAPTSLWKTNRGQALAMHATCLEKAKELHRAAALLSEALKIEPSNPFTSLNAGQLQLKLGKASDAAKHCHRAVELRPTLAGAHGCLGIALARMNHSTSALHSLSRATELEPNNAGYALNLAIVMGQQGLGREARNLVQHLMERFPEDPAVQRAASVLKLRSRSGSPNEP